jgi:hypothetical protein
MNFTSYLHCGMRCFCLDSTIVDFVIRCFQRRQICRWTFWKLAENLDFEISYDKKQCKICTSDDIQNIILITCLNTKTLTENFQFYFSVPNKNFKQKKDQKDVCKNFAQPLVYAISIVLFQPRLNNSKKILFKSQTVFKISIVLLGILEILRVYLLIKCKCKMPFSKAW